MMVLSALRPDAGLFEYLARRARSASLRRLGVDAAMGAGTFVAALRWSSVAPMVIASAATLLFSYGAWGLLDRAKSIFASRLGPRSVGLIEALCALCVALGVVAVAGVLLTVWAIALGTWIS